MIRFLLTRATALLGGLALASVLIFAVIRIAPGDAAQVIAGVDSPPERVDAIRADLGLNDPILTQYFRWIGGVLSGDLGTSSTSGVSIAGEIAARLEVTLPLTVLSLVFAVLIAIPAGVFAGLWYRDSRGQIVSFAAQLVAAIPVVWAGMMLVVVFALWADWLPAQGFPVNGWADPWNAVAALVLPAMAIASVEAAILTRIIRSAVIDTARSEHVIASAARGGTRTAAALRRGLPAAAVSLVSVLGVQLAGLIGGTVVIERLFALPGLGNLLVGAVGTRDLVTVQSVVLIITAAILLIGILVDGLHTMVDPRLRRRSAT